MIMYFKENLIKSVRIKHRKNIGAFDKLKIIGLNQIP